MNDHIPQSYHTLPPGTVLPHNYIIERVLGEGGFGITYCCKLRHTDEHFALKEYFPNHIAYRRIEQESSTVVPFPEHQELFERERRRFLTEASILQEFQQLEHIVGVKDIIEANGTFYLVMELIDGLTLKQYIKENEPLSFDELFQLIAPVLRDLIQVHKKGLLHGDISPDNLILGTDNQFHLIDFGSANLESMTEQESKTVILKHGFAPPEQYFPNGKLGPWTDVYGMCATIYYALTGMTPQYISFFIRPKNVSIIQLSMQLPRRDMESFFATLKKELLYRIPTYRMTREEIKRIVFNYVFTYYNQKRIYTSNPNSLPPAANRRLFEEDIQRAA